MLECIPVKYLVLWRIHVLAVIEAESELLDTVGLVTHCSHRHCDNMQHVLPEPYRL